MRLAFAFLALGVAGCALILGIEDKPLTPAVEAGAPVGDTCSHFQPEPFDGGEDDDDAAAQKQYFVAAHTIDFSPGPGRSTLGFDLDGTCTCDPSSTRHDAGPSCTSRVSRGCDEDGGTGIDNAFGGLAQLFTAANSTQTDGILCGRSTFLAVITDYNGQANDAAVKFGFVLSPGLQTPHEDAEPPSNCNNDGGDRPLPTVYTPRWDGTDVWSSDTSFVVTNTRAPSSNLTGYVRDWVLVARAADGAKIRIPFGPVVGDARGTVVRAELSKRADGGIAIVDGEIAARLTTAALIPAISSVPIGGKAGFLCPNNQNAASYLTVVNAICSARDVLSNPLDDFTDAGCDAVSAGVHFTGDPANMALPQDPFDAGASECPDADTSCD